MKAITPEAPAACAFCTFTPKLQTSVFAGSLQDANDVPIIPTIPGGSSPGAVR